MASVADGATALVVSHGGAIEPTLVACLPTPTTSSGAHLLGHCDGARLGFADGAFVDLRFRRAPTMPAPSAWPGS
jgi:broad specificity phosphatase PhoE